MPGCVTFWPPVYSRVGQILQSGHLGDLKHVRTNGLEASYPDELADFLAEDQFSSLNWRLYSKLDTMDLGQWETQSKSEQPQHDDYLQPKWITEWQIPDHLDPTWDDLPEVPDEFPMPEAFNHPRMVAFPSLIF